MFSTFLALWLVASFSAAFSFFLDFALGFPMSDEPNEHAIFFRYTLFLAKRRIMKEDSELYTIIKDDKQEVIRQAKEKFTYEYAFGYCSVCSNVWISIILFNIMHLFVYPLPYYTNTIFWYEIYTIGVVLVSHVILRKYLLA